MVGFILMVDAFRPDNGATRFVPGSHRRSTAPGGAGCNLDADHQDEVLACGPAGSVIVYNGSVWHGHAANRSAEPRRSIQGAYIRRDAKPTVDLAGRMRPETYSRLGPVAKYLLELT
jgi:ectoine hydroxylase-related dioxygenase (phytanoyl-CoA dioxygenase family)